MSDRHLKNILEGVGRYLFLQPENGGNQGMVGIVSSIREQDAPRKSQDARRQRLSARQERLCRSLETNAAIAPSTDRLNHAFGPQPVASRRQNPLIQWLVTLTRQPLAYWILATVLIGISLRFLRFAMVRPLWCDEAYLATSILSRDFKTLFSPLEYGQIAPSGFLLGTWLNVATWGASEVSLRAPAIIMGVAALAFFPWAIRPLAKREVSWVATVLLAVSIFPVRLASELKPYSIDLCLSVLLLGCAARSLTDSSAKRTLFDRQNKGHHAWLWFGLFLLLCVATPWISFPGVFVAGGMIAGRFFWQLSPPLPRLPAGLLLQIPVNDRSTITRILPYQFESCSLRLHRALIGGFLVGIPLVLSTLFMWNCFGKSAYEHGNQVMNLKVFWQDAMPRSFSAQEILRWLAEAHTGSMVAYPVGAEHGGSAATTIFLVLGIVLLAFRQRQILFLLVSPFLLTALAAALQKYPYGGSARIAQHLAPMICLLVAWGVIALFPRKTISGRRLCRLLVAVIGLGFVVGQGIYFIQKPAKDPNDTSMRETLASIYMQTPLTQSIRCAADDHHVAYAEHQLCSEQGAKFRANRLLEEAKRRQQLRSVITTSEKVLFFSHQPIHELSPEIQLELAKAFPSTVYSQSRTYPLVHSNRDGRHAGYLFTFERALADPHPPAVDPPMPESHPTSERDGLDFVSNSHFPRLP